MAWLAEVPAQWNWDGEEPAVAARKAWEREASYSHSAEWEKRRLAEMESRLARALQRGGFYHRPDGARQLQRTVATSRRRVAYYGAARRAQMGSAVAQGRLEWQALVIWHRRAVVKEWEYAEYRADLIVHAEERLRQGTFQRGYRKGQAYPESHRRTVERQRNESLASYAEQIIKLQAVVETPIVTYREYAGRSAARRGIVDLESYRKRRVRRS
jgi:hypothetical protein